MNKKLVVITGASSVFGKEMAKLFNQQGYPMLLLARRTEKIKELNLDFRNVIIEKVDVTNYSAIQKAILCAEKLYGKTDLLVNNAGVMLLGDISTQIPMEWEKMLETNVLGVLNGMKIVLEDMKKRNTGTIINIYSIAGYKAFKDHAAYVASKFGVHGLTEVIRQEVAPYSINKLY
ncbi:SDR family oxidoreductase [Enterococcus faecalis]|jgi:NADP-dependent 3-hydroxy acid dehydrogenase YdfG|nr:SDR family oxidoreductase [Enterococcus faecalis]EGO9491069.1 SDR family NAD(P)-dependent oxidoreductase [Enterococcus faecalis]EHS8400626.1 SDR family oxidoreductase [Enterococcus faecalis]EJC3754594.1 SDR family oxidoreductase [Enterococcus faecalis]